MRRPLHGRAHHAGALVGPAWLVDEGLGIFGSYVGTVGPPHKVFPNCGLAIRRQVHRLFKGSEVRVCAWQPGVLSR